MSFETPNSALQVANSILQRSLNEKDNKISHLKLQKILYILHGWHLAKLDQPAFYDLVEAWNYGPVVASVYHTFKGYKDQLIDKLEGKPVDEKQCPQFKRVADKVWNRYKGRDSFQLVYLTHEGGTPWDIARNDERSQIISNDLIKGYYKELLEELGEAVA